MAGAETELSKTPRGVRAESPIAALAAQTARPARRGTAVCVVLGLGMAVSEPGLSLLVSVIGLIYFGLLGASVAAWLWVMGWPETWSPDFVPVPHRRAVHLAATVAGAVTGAAIGNLSTRTNSAIVFGMLLGAAGGAGASIWRAARWLGTRWGAPMLVDRGLASTGGNERVALACFTEAIRLEPSYARAYYERAALLIRLAEAWRPPAWALDGAGRPTRGDLAAAALADLDRAIGLRPGFAAAFALRAESRLAGRPHDTPEGEREASRSSAITDLGEAIRLDPTSAPYHKSRGDLQPSGSDEELGDYDEATRLGPDSAEYRAVRGRSHHVRGNFDLAIADYSEALTLRPGDLTALMGRSAAYRDKGDYGRHEADEAEIRWATRR